MLEITQKIGGFSAYPTNYEEDGRLSWAALLGPYRASQSRPYLICQADLQEIMAAVHVIYLNAVVITMCFWYNLVISVTGG